MKVKGESEKVGLKLNIQKTKIMASGPITSWQIDGETVVDFIFLGSKICRWWLQPWNLKTLTPWKESYDQLRQNIKKQRHYFVNKGPSSQGYGFSSGHVWIWQLDYKESWVQKNWCFWTVVLEKTLESPLDCKKIQLVHPKENQSWTFFGRTDVEAETPILWPPDEKNCLIRRDADVGEGLKAGREGNNRGWDGWMASPLNGHEFEQALGVGDRQGGLACCSIWGCKGSDRAIELNWKKVKSLSRIRLFATPWTVAYHAPPSMGFSRQEYWSGLPFPSPGDLPNPGI